MSVLTRHQSHQDNKPQHDIGITFRTGDLVTGEGVEAAVDGAAAIVHCATSTKGDAEATRNLIRAASRAGAPHLVYVSIVGIDRLPSWGYPKAKLQAERAVEVPACRGRSCGRLSSTTTYSRRCGNRPDCP